MRSGRVDCSLVWASCGKFLFPLIVNSCSLPFTRYDGLDGEEDESDTVGMRSGRVDCSLIWASCGVLEFCPKISVVWYPVNSGQRFGKMRD